MGLVRKNLVSVDPGASHCAYAFFGTDGTLLSCGYEEGTGRTLSEYLHTRFVAGYLSEPELVIERMQVYKGYKATDDNDLILVSETAGAIKARFPQSFSVTASNWKGQVPKDVTKKRVRDKIGGDAIDDHMQRVRAGDKNHIYDAIGIGLWFLQTCK